MADTLERAGNLEQGTLNRLIDRFRGDDDARRKANERLRARLGDAMDEMFGLTPGEVVMMNNLPPQLVDEMLSSIELAVKHPNGSVHYSRSETGGPHFEVTTTHSAKPAKGGGPHEHHVRVNVHCMK
jgi:hypothetical protein